MNDIIQSEEAPEYKHVVANANVNPTEYSDDDVLLFASNILLGRIKATKFSITSPQDTKRFLVNKLCEQDREVFSVILLDNRHQVIDYVELFYGTIDGASVYPREVVKLALEHNAAALILAHNHPSGIPEPSTADEHITQRLIKSCALVDVRILDHVIVGGVDTVSLSERGLGGL